MADFLAELAWRGLIHQTTNAEQLSAWLAEGRRTLYAGFDPTADSLHVGSLLPLTLLRRFQRAGHQPIALLGGATGMIGDPTGKSEERSLLPVEVLEENVTALQMQIANFLDFDCGSTSAKVVNNHDWMKGFSYLEFLRDVGKNFPVGVMMAKDSVRSRLQRTESGLSYTEFSYMLLQAYDFVFLLNEHDCYLQIGGSDQWGNITAGIDLGRRMCNVRLYGMTCPLLTTSDGTKMGKTEQGAVWLSEKRTIPYQFFQYWFNTDDNDVSHCLRMLTDFSREEIESLDEMRQKNASRRDSQLRLAEELTRMVHGQAAVDTAKKAREILFGGEILQMDDAQLSEIFADVPSQELPREKLTGTGLNLVEAWVTLGLARSKSEARRTIQQGGAYLNNSRVDDIEMQLQVEQLASQSIMVLRSGKRKYALLRFV